MIQTKKNIFGKLGHLNNSLKTNIFVLCILKYKTPRLFYIYISKILMQNKQVRLTNKTLYFDTFEGKHMSLTQQNVKFPKIFIFKIENEMYLF